MSPILPREELPDARERAPDLDDDFSSGLTPRWWVPHYLPHGTLPERSAARCRIVPGGVEPAAPAAGGTHPKTATLRASGLVGWTSATC